jgi:protein-S-isoprenylcysteine O-methyltransferase Ste14
VTAEDAVRIAIAAWALLGVACAALFLRRVRRSTGRTAMLLFTQPTAREWLSFVALLAYPALLIASTWHAHRTPFRPLVAPGAATLAAGGAVLAASLALYAAAVATLGAAFRIGIDRVAPGTPVMRGLYRRIRHPVYLALLLGFAGTVVLLPSPFAAACFAVALLGFRAQARREERWLLERFGGDYAFYMQNTGMFLPRVR